MPYMDTQKMRTIYYMGNCYEIMNNRTEAAYCYREIAEHDPHYQDVAEKVKQFADIPAKVVEVKKNEDDEDEDTAAETDGEEA